MNIFKLVFSLREVPAVQVDFLKARILEGVQPSSIDVRFEDGTIPKNCTNPEAFAIAPFFHESGLRVFHCLGIGTFALLPDETTKPSTDPFTFLLRPELEGWTSGRVCYSQYLVALPATTQADFARYWIERCDPAVLSDSAYAQITDNFLRRLKELPANWLSTNHVSVVYEYLCHSVDVLFKRYTDVVSAAEGASQAITERPVVKPVEIESKKVGSRIFNLGTASVSVGMVDQLNEEDIDGRR